MASVPTHPASLAELYPKSLAKFYKARAMGDGTAYGAHSIGAWVDGTHTHPPTGDNAICKSTRHRPLDRSIPDTVIMLGDATYALASWRDDRTNTLVVTSPRTQVSSSTGGSSSPPPKNGEERLFCG